MCVHVATEIFKSIPSRPLVGEVEAGARVVDVCRKHGISDATFYNWHKKYGDMSSSDIKRLKELEAETRKLKQLLASRCWTIMLTRICFQKVVGATAKREAVARWQDRFQMSERRACVGNTPG